MMQDKLQNLTRKAKSLKTEQGRVARRNARRAVLEALRAVREALDVEYPAEKKGAKKRAKKWRAGPSSVAHTGLAEIQPNTVRFGQIYRAGIQLKHVAPTHKPEDDTTTRNHGSWYGPTWAVSAPPGTTIAQLKKARRSLVERAALATLSQLWREQQQVQRRVRADKVMALAQIYGGSPARILAMMAAERGVCVANNRK